MAGGFDRRAIPAAAREGFWNARDGHPIRRIDWPDAAREGRPPRGSLLFVPGRGDSYEKYLETLDYWHRRGWRVTALDWRWQAGSGRLGSDRMAGDVSDFAVWVADLAEFWEDWSQGAPGPRVIAGHSMGGHLVLRTLVEHRIDPVAAVLSAPMLGFTAPIPNAIGQAVARLMCRIGDPARMAWKFSEKPGSSPRDRSVLLTHDPERYADELWWRENRPELVMGPGSWGWVERAYASTRLIEAAGALEQVSVPVLIVSTSADRLVKHPAAVRAAARLPHGELVEFGNEAYHEILREVSPVRDRAMAAIDEFLDRVAPPAP